MQSARPAHFYALLYNPFVGAVCRFHVVRKPTGQSSDCGACRGVLSNAMSGREHAGAHINVLGLGIESEYERTRRWTVREVGPPCACIDECLLKGFEVANRSE